MDQKLSRARSGRQRTPPATRRPPPSPSTSWCSASAGRLAVLVVQRPDGSLGLPGGCVGPDEVPAKPPRANCMRRPALTTSTSNSSRRSPGPTGIREAGSRRSPISRSSLRTHSRPIRSPGGSRSGHPALAFDHTAILAAALDQSREAVVVEHRGRGPQVLSRSQTPGACTRRSRDHIRPRDVRPRSPCHRADRGDRRGAPRDRRRTGRAVPVCPSGSRLGRRPAQAIGREPR